ncbi:hypothetical protein [Allokutzneria sp. NRRL B-24872]|uniref:hypothetical protein n=1 Tax=Allokutzneria sp. NRRL B-24872 TaxID=1137961 RepID=UPI000A37127C|nr:hypothetical protein [Allokutzneria sp. NRRL B-24872]
MIYWAIIGAEVGFWLFIALGLFSRYVLKMPKLGVVFLICTPLTDVFLLAVAGYDLSVGGKAEFHHAVAALYLGISVVWGHKMIKWADQRMNHRFAGGPPPVRKPEHGRAHAQHLRSGWFRHVASWALGVSLLAGGLWLADWDLGRAEALADVAMIWTVVLVVDGVYSLSFTFKPKPEPRQREVSLSGS